MYDDESVASTIQYTPPPTLSDASVSSRPLSETVPGAGQTFIITDRATNAVLTLLNGELRLQEGYNPEGGYHWACIERDGWLGLYNTVSKTYIGHDGDERVSFLIATAREHRLWEQMCVRQVQGGGHKIMVERWGALWNVAIAHDGRRLIRTEGKATTWEFVRPGAER